MYPRVGKSLRKISCLLRVSASSSLRKSPWAIMAIWANWLRSSPMMFTISPVTSRVLVTRRPSGRCSSASARWRVVPPPRLAGRSYSGERRTV